jgi:hypothetical protein
MLRKMVRQAMVNIAFSADFLYPVTDAPLVGAYSNLGEKLNGRYSDEGKSSR